MTADFTTLSGSTVHPNDPKRILEPARSAYAVQTVRDAILKEI